MLEYKCIYDIRYVRIHLYKVCFSKLDEMRLSFAFLFAVVGAVDLLVTKFTLQLLRLLLEHTTKDTNSGKKTES